MTVTAMQMRIAFIILVIVTVTAASNIPSMTMITLTTLLKTVTKTFLPRRNIILPQRLLRQVIILPQRQLRRQGMVAVEVVVRRIIIIT